MNNWYAITGVASSGKTTTIQELEKKGYRVVHESATEFVKQQFQKGYIIEDIRKNEEVFQKLILQLKVFYEGLLDPEAITFIDRGIPDTIAFCKMYNIPIDSGMEKIIKSAQYKKVFLLERLPLVKEDYRPESEEEIAQMDIYNENAYHDLGHTVIKVPVMPIEKRVQYILENL